jgi:hypothetical protein
VRVPTEDRGEMPNADVQHGRSRSGRPKAAPSRSRWRRNAARCRDIHDPCEDRQRKARRCRGTSAERATAIRPGQPLVGHWTRWGGARGRSRHS